MADAKFPWREVFRRSDMAPRVWVVDGAFTQRVWKVVGEAGLPVSRSSGLFSNSTWSAPLLDGVVIALDTYGFPQMPSGTRVIGNDAMRLLCLKLGLEPPKRRLSDDPELVSGDELLERFESFRRRPLDTLDAQADVGVGVSDRSGIRAVVRRLFDDVELSEPHDLAPGALGRAGFMNRDVEALTKAGLSTADALLRVSKGLSPREVAQSAGVDWERLRPWIGIGYSGGSAAALVNAGASHDEARRLMGRCSNINAERILMAGKTLEEFEAYLSAGLKEYEAARAAEEGLTVDEAIAKMRR